MQQEAFCSFQNNISKKVMNSYVMSSYITVKMLFNFLTVDSERLRFYRQMLRIPWDEDKMENMNENQKENWNSKSKSEMELEAWNIEK